jgi:uncharacterized SAM-binding protein YcdF (DUF218 family)
MRDDGMPAPPRHPAAQSRVLRRLRLAVLVLAAWALVHLAAICVDGCDDDDEPADLAVVLGNHVAADGTVSGRLCRRLDRALELYQHGKVPTIVVSGGRDPGSPFEAEAMKRYLVERGVPAGAIVEDRGGENTYLTARFTADYMQRHGLRSVIAVSQYYHVTRTKLALRRFGAPEVRGAHAAMVLEAREPWSLLREVVGYYAYLFKDYGDPA